MAFDYNPTFIYFTTLFICITLLMKALKDMCKDTDIDQHSGIDNHSARK